MQLNTSHGRVVEQAMASATDALPMRAVKRVLILDVDIYKSVGGGQSAYRKIIEQSPDCEFYYFIDEELEGANRPFNAKPIKWRETYYANLGDLPQELSHFYNDYLRANQLAASVKGALGATSFDVVDAPDYRTETLFIRGAMARHGVGIGKVALALHGLLSSVFREEWSGRKPDPRMMAELRVRERLQYRAVDARYAMSAFYADLWAGWSGGIRATRIDPLCMVGPFEPVTAQGDGLPDLLFVGRRERCKGPDLFVDIAWTLPVDKIGRVRMIGPDATGFSGVGAMDVIDDVAARRNIKLDVVERLTHAELDELYRRRSILVLPARYETFNLVALEALRLGCPVFVGSGAGIARWIREEVPELSHLILDLSCSRISSDAVRQAVENYDSFRQHLVDTLKKRSLRKDLASLTSMYDGETVSDANAVHQLGLIRSRLDSFNAPRPFSDLQRTARVRLAARKAVPLSLRQLVRKARIVRQRVRSAYTVIRHPYGFIRAKAIKTFIARSELSHRAVRQIQQARDIEGVRHRLLTMGERAHKDVDAKLKSISSDISNSLVGRVHIFNDMARLEQKRDPNSIIAATYYLRTIRWLGRDQFNNLPFVVDTLKAHNFKAEADAAIAMFGTQENRSEAIRSILDDQYAANLRKPDLPFAVLDDRRNGSRPCVAVVSSLYNAEKKLRTLLDNIASQTLSSDGRVEIILVDSNSPTKEYEVFKVFAAERPDIPIVFARSAERETIQAAWNRGIKLARAPYLCFFGADEGMHPDCLSQLYDALQGNPDVDWVIADSIVTNVSPSATYVSDVMKYDRRGYENFHVYLDTTYLNWVGGMYRKSIHDRFGYYDEKFRAAGDTEFKLRIIKHIKTQHIPRPLGVFNNYPEERTTQHPRAEIEDLRAWYLHRTPAGMGYCFDGLPVSEAQALFRNALNYRKAYFHHQSSDIDLADALASYLKGRGEDMTFASNANTSTQNLLSCIRPLELLDFRIAPRKRQLMTLRALQSARQQAGRDAASFRLDKTPVYELFNDNRYEQHWWSWSN